MAKQILFIQGGNEGGYKADRMLVNSLQENLGDGYVISYPRLEADESKPDFGWVGQIRQHILKSGDDVIIVAHSLGASMLLKYVSENTVTKKIKGIFLIATPFWSGNEDWVSGLKLQQDFAGKLPHDVPVFFYHCKDDAETPFPQFEAYKQKVPEAVFREMKSGGHQLNNDLSLVAQDVRSLR